MEASPGREQFVEVYERGEPQVVWTSLVADLETPVSAFLKLGEGLPYSSLLESVEGGAIQGRYSVIGIKPDLVWRCFGERAEINRRLRSGGRFEPLDEPALPSLRRLIAGNRIAMPPALPPPAAGLFGQMSYDMVRQMERLPAKNPDKLGLPDAVYVRPTLVAVFDNIEDRVTLVTPVHPRPDLSPVSAYEHALERLADAVADFDRGLRHQPRQPPPSPIEPVSNTTREAYAAMVERCKAYIVAGDAFQIVPSQRFELPFSLPPFALYRALRRLNPSPFLFFLDLDGYALVGSSPELRVRLRDGKVTVRPIAGTRRRGATKAEDEALAKDMLSDPKELAEHLMLLDLGRNDVGRVAEIGSVRVTDSFFLEYYSQVMHIVSNVEGKIDPKRDAIDALMAGFPAGTVSGAPKVRAMEIIDELEDEKRGLYAGCVGYFSANGEMDSCIVLRTSVVKDGTMYVQAGAGVVADSVPEREQAECVSKAAALFRAAEEAVRFATRARRRS